MSRFTSLPDPFVATLRALPGFREFTEGFQLCPECERCERSVVYLTPREQESARSLGLRMYGRGGGTRINRQGCRCPFYEGPDRGCEIYVDRPLICNLFPLDVIERDEDGRHWWVLFGACAEVERGRLRGRIDEARALATAIDGLLPDELRLAFMADAAGALFEPEFYDHPIHYLLPLSPPTRGAGSGERGAVASGQG